MARPRMVLALSLLCLGMLLGGSGCPAPPSTTLRKAEVNTQGSEVASVPQEVADFDRMEEVRRVCNRKAPSAMNRCWNGEYQRTGNRKMEAQVEVMIVVGADGTAKDVKVVANVGGTKELEACVAEEARGWTYPEGRQDLPVNCRFLLRATM